VLIDSTKLKELEETNTFTIKSTFKYNLYYFYKVIINIKALKYFIAKYKQF
jgi:phosphoenolpyruvate carboxylase